MAMTTSPRPKPKPLSMKRPMKRPPDLGMSEAEKTDLQNKMKADVKYNKKGGKVAMKEGSAKDTAEDKAMAKKRGMSMAKWEKSAADVKHDAPKKMASGGVMRGTGAAIRGKKYAGEL